MTYFAICIWNEVFTADWNTADIYFFFYFVSYVIWYIFKLLVDGKKVSSARESVSSKLHKNENIGDHDNGSGASDFYENKLTIALCPKAELDDDCKYFYFISDLHIHCIPYKKDKSLFDA